MISEDQIVERVIRPPDLDLLRAHLDHEAYANGKTWAGRDPYEIESGVAGQIKAAQYIVVDPFSDNTRTFDLLVEVARIDVKTTALKYKGSVDLSWHAAVPDDDFHKRKVDAYVFCCVNLNMNRWWGVGRITKADFTELAVRYRRGDEWGPGYDVRVREDCYAVPYTTLYPLLTSHWWRKV